MATIPQATGTLPNRVAFRLDDADWERLQIFCVKSRTSVQAVCSEALEKYLDAQGFEVSDIKKPNPRARAS